jgi:hypothetical protein
VPVPILPSQFVTIPSPLHALYSSPLGLWVIVAGLREGPRSRILSCLAVFLSHRPRTSTFQTRNRTSSRHTLVLSPSTPSTQFLPCDYLRALVSASSSLARSLGKKVIRARWLRKALISDAVLSCAPEGSCRMNMSLKRTRSLSRGISRVASLRICASCESRQIELGEISRDRFLRRRHTPSTLALPQPPIWPRCCPYPNYHPTTSKQELFA